MEFFIELDALCVKQGGYNIYTENSDSFRSILKFAESQGIQLTHEFKSIYIERVYNGNLRKVCSLTDYDIIDFSRVNRLFFVCIIALKKGDNSAIEYFLKVDEKLLTECIQEYNFINEILFSSASKLLARRALESEELANFFLTTVNDDHLVNVLFNMINRSRTVDQDELVKRTIAKYFALADGNQVSFAARLTGSGIYFDNIKIVKLLLSLIEDRRIIFDILSWHIQAIEEWDGRGIVSDGMRTFNSLLVQETLGKKYYTVERFLKTIIKRDNGIMIYTILDEVVRVTTEMIDFVELKDYAIRKGSVEAAKWFNQLLCDV